MMLTCKHLMQIARPDSSSRLPATIQVLQTSSPHSRHTGQRVYSSEIFGQRSQVVANLISLIFKWYQVLDEMSIDVECFGAPGQSRTDFSKALQAQASPL
jgi:hypothetical protein